MATFVPHSGWRSLENMQRSFDMVLGALSQRKQMNQRRMDRDLKMGLALMASDPEGGGAIGDSLVEKYGDKVPWLSPAVDTYKQRGVEFAGMKGAYDQWMQGLSQGEQQADAAQQKAQQAGQMAQVAQQMAPMLGANPGMAGMATAIPQMTQQMAQQAQQQAQHLGDPNVIQQNAFEGLSENDKIRASIYANATKSPIVPYSTFDPDKLTAAQYPLHFRELLDPDQLEAARIGANIQPSTRVLGEIEKRHRAAIDEIGARGEQAGQRHEEDMAELGVRERIAGMGLEGAKVRSRGGAGAAGGKGGEDFSGSGWFRDRFKEDRANYETGERGRFAPLHAGRMGGVLDAGVRGGQIPAEYAPQLAEDMNQAYHALIDEGDANPGEASILAAALGREAPAAWAATAGSQAKRDQLLAEARKQLKGAR
jgi:hypothetical protein